MTPEKREEIARLAGEMHDKKMHFERLSMGNIANLSAEDARKATIAYELARAEYYEACTALRAAMPTSADTATAESILRGLQQKDDQPMNQAAGLADWQLAQMGIRRDPNASQGGIKPIRADLWGSNLQSWETTPKG